MQETAVIESDITVIATPLRCKSPNDYSIADQHDLADKVTSSIPGEEQAELYKKATELGMIGGGQTKFFLIFSLVCTAASRRGTSPEQLIDEIVAAESARGTLI